jgi:hypothetical protein
VSRAGWSTVGFDGKYRYETAALSVPGIHLVRAGVPRRGLALAAPVHEFGSTWSQHRRRVEQHCVRVERASLRFQLLPGDLPGSIPSPPNGKSPLRRRTTSPRPGHDMGIKAMPMFRPGRRRERRRAGAARAAGINSVAVGTGLGALD